jgi:hypothetical protein
LPTGFFPQLGRRFLRAYHATFAASPYAVALVAERDGTPFGFLVGTVDNEQLRVTYDRFLVASDHDASQRGSGFGINLLMGNERWHVDEVARPSFGNEFEALSPSHPRAATGYVDYALQFSVVMRTGFGVRVDCDGTRPQLVCAGRGMRNGRRTCHARRLGGIKI